ncbi:MAG: histidine kinase [Verrucomicrobia bacterium]|nr:histidine kinase [Verrucomicrobiota bacterium]
MKNTIYSKPPEATDSWQRRRIAWLCVFGWTVFVGLALWWLLRGNAGPTVWIVHKAATPDTPVAERDFGLSWTEIHLQRGFPWLLFGPYVALVAACFPLERGRLRLSLPLNLVACVAFLAASHSVNCRTRVKFSRVTIIKSEPTPGVRETNTFQVRISEGAAAGWRRHVSGTNLANLLGPPHPDFKLPPPPPGERKLDLWSMLVDLLAYGAIVGLAHSILFYRRFREREHRALFLESNLASARLHTLRAQLHPHFLFNSLNAIAALLRRDPRLAEATLMSLSELLRLALSQSERPEIALREELQFVERYLEIQQTRFGDKLRVEQEIEQAALDCLVPALVLQPLVENAIRHGIEPAEKAGVVRLTARRENGNLVLIVEDNGVGLPNSAPDFDELKTAGDRPGATAQLVPARSPAPVPSGGSGIGLTNLRARLETLYGPRQKIELAPRPEGGVTVRLEVPWHPVTGIPDDGRAIGVGETGSSPVPPGEPPDRTTSAPEGSQAFELRPNAAAIPLAESPNGAGESPALPSRTGRGDCDPA